MVVMTSQLSVPLLSRLRELFPGFAVSALVAATAQFLSEHYGAPAMLMALLLGLALNSLGLVPAGIAALAGDLSRWCLLVAIAAVGIKTSLARMLEVGAGAIALLVLETLFLGGWVMAGLHLLG